jgi:hypothetical protein
MPSRKKKCPGCGHYIYVRTRPEDRVRVLVTEEQAAAIEEQWTCHYREKELARIGGLPGYETARAKMNRSLGREPDDHEVVIELTRRELAQHKADKQWGLYRNAKLQIATELQALHQADSALAAYLDVCYLDINGPCNLGIIEGIEMLDESPPFEPERAWLSPQILGDILEEQERLGFDTEKLKEVFLSVAVASHTELHLPVSPEAAWLKLLSGLSGRPDAEAAH